MAQPTFTFKIAMRSSVDCLIVEGDKYQLLKTVSYTIPEIQPHNFVIVDCQINKLFEHSGTFMTLGIYYCVQTS